MKYGNAFFAWMPLAVTITGICLLVYGAVQQNYRQSLNDPQIEMAESAAYRLGQSELHASAESVLPTRSVDYANELGPWLAIYDGAQKLIGTSGTQVKQPPQPPSGVFESAKRGQGKDTDRPHENRITWQTEAGIRQALVIVYVPERDLYVVSGRNMREIENRERRLGMFVGAAWLVLLVATLGTQFVVTTLKSR